MPSIDFFNFFRWVLALIATVYATVITVQSLWGWYIWLAGGDKYIGILRRYLIVHGLRMRFATFWGDVLLCVLLTVAFFMLMRAHQVIHNLGDAVASAKMPLSPIHVRAFSGESGSITSTSNVEFSVQH